MTTSTDTGRRTPEQLLDQARERYRGRALPVKSKIAEDLSTHFNKARTIHETLSNERDAEAANKRREHRQRMARLGRPKGNGSVRMVRRPAFTSPSEPIVAIAPELVTDPIEIAGPDMIDLSLGDAVAVTSDRPAEVVPERVAEPVAVTVAEVPARRAKTWPIFLLALPAFVAIWSGWVDLGRLTGFGVVHPFPGIWDGVKLNTAITLPIGLETYAAYALYVWLSGQVPARARAFAKWSAIGSLALGAAGQVAYHLMVAAGMTRAPWLITTVVACLPVAVLGMGAALRHLVHADEVR